MLFEKVLEMSLLSCYVIAVVLVIRLLLNKCERKYSFFLWFVVFLNLILPVSIEGPFSLIPERIAEGTIVQEGDYKEAIPEADGAQYAGTGQDTSTIDTIGDSVAVKDTIANSTAGNPAAMNNTADNNILNKEQSYWEYAGSLNDGKVAESETDEVVTGTVIGEEDASVYSVHQSVIQPQLPDIQEPPATAAGEINIPMTVAGFVWLAGLAVIWGISLCKGILLNRQLKKSREGQEISREGVVCAENISAPFLWGICKPVIYLPASIEEEERTYIIAHESYHKKRFDHITKPVVFVIVTIHWFNPLVWLAYALFVRDMEISCDEAVLAHTRRDIKKQYASSLLKYAAKQNGFVLAPLTFGEPSLKSRIQNVLGYKKRGLVVTIAAVCVVTLTACGLIMRPEGETQSGSEVVQGNGEQDATVPEEPTAEPVPTKVPEVTWPPEDSAANPYSVYFQDILQANYEERDGKYYAITAARESVKYSYVDSVADYKEPEAAYSAKSDLSLENGGVCRIDWIKLSSDLNLENLTFDMRKELEEANLEDGFVHGVFYDREEDWVYVIISNHTGTPSTTWMICFRPENPTDYEIYDYEYSSWFGECYYADGTIYLHGGSVDTPYVIDVETKEGRLCTAEYTAARAATYEMSAEYAETHESALYVYWMKGFGKWEDVDIFSGLLMEAMDFFPGVAEIYVASRDGKVLETMLVFAESGEVVIVENSESNPAVRPLTQAQLDWFNESFFNQGYLGVDANIYEGLRNQFLTHEYARPEDINISEVFYNGVGEELTEDDKLCLSGEARWKLPLYTGDMVLLSEEEHAGVAEIDVDVSKTSWDTMDSILEMHTGLALWETNRCGMDGLYFNKRDRVFYHFHGDTNALFVQVRSGHYNADGTITLYYVRSGSQNWIDEATEEFAVVLQPAGDSYLFVANASLENLQLQQGQEQQEEASPYKLTAVDHEDYNAVFENYGYQYHFKLDMDTTNLFWLFGEGIERSDSTGTWTVTPVYALNGAKEELLGELRGFTLDITSNTLVEPKYASGDRFYGIIGDVTEDSFTIQPVEAVDMDTYMEYRLDVTQSPVSYKLAEEVEYIMLDANFRGAHVDDERFLEHMSLTSDKVCCFVVKDGVILQIWEPYIP